MSRKPKGIRYFTFFDDGRLTLVRFHVIALARMCVNEFLLRKTGGNVYCFKYTNLLSCVVRLKLLLVYYAQAKFSWAYIYLICIVDI